MGYLLDTAKICFALSFIFGVLSILSKVLAVRKEKITDLNREGAMLTGAPIQIASDKGATGATSDRIPERVGRSTAGTMNEEEDFIDEIEDNGSADGGFIPEPEECLNKIEEYERLEIEERALGHDAKADYYLELVLSWRRMLLEADTQEEEEWEMLDEEQ